MSDFFLPATLSSQRLPVLFIAGVCFCSLRGGVEDNSARDYARLSSRIGRELSE